MPKLDAKDWHILHELDRDASQSLSKIGKRLHIGRDVMHYRVKRLEREGIIRNYITIIDYGKLGYLTGALYIKFQHDTPKTQQKIIEYFKQNPMIWWIVSRDGEYDFAFAFWAKNLVDLKETERALLKKYRSYFHSIKTRIYHSLTHFPRSYLAGKKRKKKDKIQIPTKVEKITDKLDEKILAYIAENARASYVEIANAIGLSAAQVHYRLKQLKAKKVILGARALIDREKIGYSWYKLDIYLDDYTAIKQIQDAIAAHPNAIYLYDILGGADIEAEFEVKNSEEMHKIENKIKHKFAQATRYTEKYQWRKEHKLIYFPR